MHRRQSVARPQHNPTPAQKARPNKYDLCPHCGCIKARVSRICLKCTISRRRTRVSTRVFWIKGVACRWIGLTKSQKTIVYANRYSKLSSINWYAQPTKDPEKFYAVCKINGKFVFMHRYIVGGKSRHIDHINRDTLDNRDDNLRPCTQAQNLANRGKPRIKKQSSKYKGVTLLPWIKGRGKPWMARLRIGYKTIHIGTFNTEEEAARAYDRAAIYRLGEFAHTNFPQ